MNGKNAKFSSLPDGRSYLPENTIIELAGSGGRYRITGKPIGYGGSGILYPGITMVKKDSEWHEGTLKVAIKECFPSCLSPAYTRADNGEIEGSDETGSLYDMAREMLFRESEITGRIYTKGFRLTPVQRTAEEEVIQLPGDQEKRVRNAMGILERLDEKGRSLSEVISNHMTGWQCFHLFGLVLRALGEVHKAGYLHGDIQEHNIFVKGWEEDEQSCEISLVDFGSTRELMEDGSTAVIADKTLFTTKGYAAPECLERNDGTLRLSPAADLYSAGILLLRMLNGRLPERRALQISVGSRFLLQRRAKAIHIPSGAVTKINELLDGLLQHDSEQRYQSVQEVLEISERIENALSKRTSSLEATDYDAFISYCHEPVASQVAENIQRKLEHYRIPKTVTRPDGKLVMGKVFLDRSEMTSGGDMGYHLQSALAHSEFLIVVLSPEAKESPWVEREIRMFLETHSRDQILTVLVEGEPDEVTPNILLECEREVNGVLRRTAVESLAADLRGVDDKGRKKKLNTEIYRILAPILGCGFDDLVQRQKAYRQQNIIRMLTAAFVVSICVLGIIGKQAITIQKNYKDALERDSISLAKESTQALERGDRKEAVTLALEALPDAGSRSERPVTDQAKAALIRSMGYYQGEMRHSISALRPSFILQMDYSTDRINENPEELERVNEEGTCFSAVDKMGTVYSWDLSDGSLLHRSSQDEIQTAVENYLSENSEGWWDPELEESVYCIAYKSEYVLELFTTRAILEADLRSGQLVVKGRYPVSKAGHHDLSLFPEKIIYMPMFHTMVQCREDTYYETDSVKRQWHIDVFDIDNLKILWSLDTESVLGEENELFSHFNDIQVVGDGSCIAITLSIKEYEDDNQSRLIIWYPQEERSFLADIKDAAIRYVGGVAHNVVTVVTSNRYSPDYDTGSFPDTKLSVIELSDGSCRFSTPVDAQVDPDGIALAWGAETIGSMVFGIEDKAYIGFWCGKKIYLFTAAEGIEVLSVTASANVCEILLAPDGKIYACTQYGEIFNLLINGWVEPCCEIKVQTDRFIYLPDNETAYMINREEGKIIVLQPEVDDCCQKVGFTENDNSGILVMDDYVLKYEEENARETLFSAYKIDYTQSGAENIKLLPDDPVAQWKAENYDEGSFCNQGEAFLYWEKEDENNEARRKLIARNVSNGMVIWQKTLEDTDKWYLIEEGMDENGNEMLYYTKNGFALLNLETGEEILRWDTKGYEQDQGLNAEKYREWKELHVSLDGKYVIGLCGSDENSMQLCVLDIEKNQWVELPEEIEDIRVDCSDSFNKNVFVTGSGRYLALYCESDREALIIDTENWSIYNKIPFTPSEDRYLFLTPDDKKIILSGYMEKTQVRDAMSGTLLSESDDAYGYFASMKYSPEHRVLIVQSEYYYLTDDGQMIPLWNGKVGSLRKKMFVTIDYNKHQMRFYPIRSLEEMIAEAKELYAL